MNDSSDEGVSPVPRRIQRRRGVAGWKMPPNTVYVGRPTRWGNPFPIDHEGTKMHCLSLDLDGSDQKDRQTAAVDLFRRWISNGKVNELIAMFLPQFPRAPETRIVARELRGKNLCCWCAPGSPCHADVLLEIANASPTIKKASP